MVLLVLRLVTGVDTGICVLLLLVICLSTMPHINLARDGSNGIVHAHQLTAAGETPSTDFLAELEKAGMASLPFIES